MNENARLTVICPCCEATLTVDRDTGALLGHREKTKKLGSFEDLQRNLAAQQQTRDDLFAQSVKSQKDRERLLEDKFREAVRRAEESGDTTPLKNPLDLD